MASDTFARIGDIKGESTDSKHKDEIEVLAWSWGVVQSGSIGHGGGGGAGKASFHDFSFVHTIDKASPLLMKACATGTHIKDATITVRKAGKGQQEYLVIKLTDVLITSVTPSFDGRRDERGRVPSVRQGRPRVQAAEGGRLARRGRRLQVRHPVEQGGLGATRFSRGASTPSPS